MNLSANFKLLFSRNGLARLLASGKISPAECDLLFDLARNVREGCIVEIGSYRGKSTIALAQGSMEGGGAPVYAIEPHETFRGEFGGEFGPKDRVAFFRNLLRAGAVETVRLVNLGSDHVAKGWNRPIGLLWIDGDHRYEAVRNDFDAWAPHLSGEAFVAFHDSTEPGTGPARVVGELVKTGRFSMVSQLDATTVLRRI